MAKIIKLWIRRAAKEALAILDAGDQEAFEKWKEKYDKEIKNEEESILNTLKGADK